MSSEYIAEPPGGSSGRNTMRAVSLGDFYNLQAHAGSVTRNRVQVNVIKVNHHAGNRRLRAVEAVAHGANPIEVHWNPALLGFSGSIWKIQNQAVGMSSGL